MSPSHSDARSTLFEIPRHDPPLRAATFSECGKYRYSLTRRWGIGPMVAFVGLNPSTADAMQDDPTIRRCIGFARSWGFDGLVMLNLFAYRATKPEVLLSATSEPVGPANDEVLAAVADVVTLVVAAWGSFKLAPDRARYLENERILVDPAVLGRTKDGHPRHPLYMKADCVPRRGLLQQPVIVPARMETPRAA